MLIYYVLLIYLLLLYLMQKQKMPISKGSYIFFAAIAIFSIIALRDYTVGADTLIYKELFYFSKDHIESLMANGFNFMFEGLFWVLTNIIRATGVSYRIYLMIISFFIVLSISVFIKRYSKSPFLSYWLFLTLGLFALSMSALRQMIALAVVLYAYRYLIEGHFKKYLLLIFIATQFHLSAIIMLPIWFVRKVKLSQRRRIVLLFTTVIVSFLLKNIVVKIIFYLNIGERYSQYINRVGESSTNILVIIFVIGITFVSTMLFEKSKLKGYKNISEEYLFNFFYLMSCINIMIIIFSQNIDILSRFGYYFFVCNLILLPNAIFTIKEKSLRLIAFLSALVVSIALFIITTPGDNLMIDQYLFFWQ